MRQKVRPMPNPNQLARQGMMDFQGFDPRVAAYLAPRLAPELMNDEYMRELEDDEGRKTTGQIGVKSNEQAREFKSIDDAEWIKALRNVYLYPTPGVKKMRQDLNYARGAAGAYGERALEGIKQGSLVDLGPLARLTDSWFGTKLAPGYVPAGEKHKADLVRMADLIQKQETGLSKAESDLMRTQLRDYFTTGLQNQGSLQRTATQGTSGQAGPNANLLYRMGRDAKEDKKDEDAKQSKLEEKVFDWANKRAEKYNDVSVHLDNINDILSQIGSRATHYETEIPGIGKVSVKKQFDLLNQFDDPLVRQYKQAAEDLIKEIRRHNYGTAQSGQEIKSLKAVTGQSIFSSPDSGISFFQNLDKTLQQAARDEAARLPSDWKPIYEKMDTTKFEDVFGGRSFKKKDGMSAKERLKQKLKGNK